MLHSKKPIGPKTVPLGNHLIVHQTLLVSALQGPFLLKKAPFYIMVPRVHCFSTLFPLSVDCYDSPVPRGPKWSFGKSGVYQKFVCRLLLSWKVSFILGSIRPKALVLHGSEVLLRICKKTSDILHFNL